MLDRVGPVPLYRQIATLIARDIRADGPAAESRLPSESDLCRRFGVARGTARRAVACLRDQGVAFTVAQRGTFVASRQTSADLPQ